MPKRARSLRASKRATHEPKTGTTVASIEQVVELAVEASVAEERIQWKEAMRQLAEWTGKRSSSSSVVAALILRDTRREKEYKAVGKVIKNLIIRRQAMAPAIAVELIRYGQSMCVWSMVALAAALRSITLSEVVVPLTEAILHECGSPRLCVRRVAEETLDSLVRGSKFPEQVAKALLRQNDHNNPGYHRTALKLLGELILYLRHGRNRIAAHVVEACSSEIPATRLAAMNQLSLVMRAAPRSAESCVAAVLAGCDEADHSVRAAALEQAVKAIRLCPRQADVLVQGLLRACDCPHCANNPRAVCHLASVAAFLPSRTLELFTKFIDTAPRPINDDVEGSAKLFAEVFEASPQFVDQAVRLVKDKCSDIQPDSQDPVDISFLPVAMRACPPGAKPLAATLLELCTDAERRYGFEPIRHLTSCATACPSKAEQLIAVLLAESDSDESVPRRILALSQLPDAIKICPERARECVLKVKRSCKSCYGGVRASAINCIARVSEACPEEASAFLFAVLVACFAAECDEVRVAALKQLVPYARWLFAGLPCLLTQALFNGCHDRAEDIKCAALSQLSAAANLDPHLENKCIEELRISLDGNARVRKVAREQLGEIFRSSPTLALKELEGMQRENRAAVVPSKNGSESSQSEDSRKRQRTSSEDAQVASSSAAKRRCAGDGTRERKRLIPPIVQEGPDAHKTVFSQVIAQLSSSILQAAQAFWPSVFQWRTSE